MAEINEFLEVFGGLKVATVVVVIAAIVFLWKICKAVEKYFRKKWEMELVKEQRMKDILSQVQKYPEWHQQSISIRNSLNESISNIETKMNEMNDSIEEMKNSGNEGKAQTWRYRILRFDDEIRHDEKHTKEHFDQILEDITEYERYCEEHPDFPNNKAVFAIKNIKNVYQQCTDEGTFL